MQRTAGCLDVPIRAQPAGHAQDTDVRIAVPVVAWCVKGGARSDRPVMGEVEWLLVASSVVRERASGRMRGDADTRA
jgi:hypothetical protein